MTKFEVIWVYHTNSGEGRFVAPLHCQYLYCQCQTALPGVCYA